MAESVPNKEVNSNLDFKLDIDSYRKRVKSYIDLHMYGTALFWADKVVSLSYEDPQDVYWLAQCMFLTGQYFRAENVICRHGIEKRNLHCLNLIVHCKLKLKKFTEAMQLLSEAEEGGCLNLDAGWEQETIGIQQNFQGALLFLKGQVYDAMEIRNLAAECYKQALRTDVQCYEALETLVQQQMLSALEENFLVESLPFSTQCSGREEEEFLRSIYKSKLNKYHNVATPASIASLPTELATNIDMLVSRAERLYYNYEYQDCRKITKKLLEEDPLHVGCLELEIGCLYELKKHSDLHRLGERLIKKMPELPVSWYAGGCYYFLLGMLYLTSTAMSSKERLSGEIDASLRRKKLCGKMKIARKYYMKAIFLNRRYGPGWLAYGHTFAVANEQQDAILTYCKASGILTGCHLMMVSLAVLHENSDIELAMRFLSEAFVVAPMDPYIRHEMGVLSFMVGNYEEAQHHFMCALELLEMRGFLSLPITWEPLLNNLAHTCRKLGKYTEALDYHRKALVVEPGNSSTYSAMGLVYALVGNMEEAVKYYHKALMKKRGDAVSLKLLKGALADMSDEELKLPGSPVILPKMGSIKPQNKVSPDNVKFKPRRRQRTGQSVPSSTPTGSFDIRSPETTIQDVANQRVVHHSPSAGSSDLISDSVRTRFHYLGAIPKLHRKSQRSSKVTSLSSDSEDDGIGFLSDSTNNSDSTLSLEQNNPISSQPMQLNVHNLALPTSAHTSQGKATSVTLHNTPEIEFCIPPEAVRLGLFSSTAPLILHRSPPSEAESILPTRTPGTEFRLISDSPTPDYNQFDEPISNKMQEVSFEEQSIPLKSFTSHICKDFQRLTSTPRFEQGPTRKPSGHGSDDIPRVLSELGTSEASTTTDSTTEHYTMTNTSFGSGLPPFHSEASTTTDSTTEHYTMTDTSVGSGLPPFHSEASTTTDSTTEHYTMTGTSVGSKLPSFNLVWPSRTAYSVTDITVITNDNPSSYGNISNSGSNVLAIDLDGNTNTATAIGVTSHSASSVSTVTTVSETISTTQSVDTKADSGSSIEQDEIDS